MARINRDVVVAIVLLLGCGVFIAASFDIEAAIFGQMSSSLWPRAILAPLTLLSLIYLIKSIAEAANVEYPSRGGVTGWLRYYRNPIVCFGLFFVFLAAMPLLGMLIGGLLFVFLMLSVLGGIAPRQMVLHALISVAAVGVMWSIFTFGLGVILPEGELISFR
jgi:hypothetical protein